MCFRCALFVLKWHLWVKHFWETMRYLRKTIFGLAIAGMMALYVGQAGASVVESLYDRANASLHLEFETTLAFDCRFGFTEDNTAPKALSTGLCIFDKSSRQFHLVSESADPTQPAIQSLLPTQILSFGQAVLREGVFVKTPVDQIQIRIPNQIAIANLSRQEAFALTDAMDAAGFIRQERAKAIFPPAPPAPPLAHPHYFFSYPYAYPYPHGPFYHRRWH